MKMESKIEKLFNAIEEKQESFNKCVELFGLENDLTKSTYREIVGMEEAFEIITGMTVTDYFLAKMDN